jgi:hypothetical protein
MLLQKLNPCAGYVLIVGRGDGKVLILGTPNAGNRLAFINAQSSLEHEVHALETERYREIERDLIERFRAYADDGLGHWVHADYLDVVKAMDEYDADTGRRTRNGSLAIGDRAYVPALGCKGRVEGFEGSRVIFQPERREGHYTVPRSQIKPVLRPAA